MRIRTGQYLLLLASMLLPGVAAGACLLNDYSISAEYARSVAVVTGRVVAERAVTESGRHYDGVVYTVTVDEVYRGDLGRLLELFSENSSGRFPMQLQERYLLFIYKYADRLLVDNCGNSGPVSEKAAVLQTVKAIAKRERGG